MSSPSSPECIDPEDIAAFASTCASAVPEEPCFQELLSTLFTPSNTASFSPSVRMYIVRQPVPAKHRRSYVEVKDLRNLCGRSNPSLTSENDLKDAVIVMKKISCSDHQDRSPALSVPPSKAPLCDTGSASPSNSSNSDWSPAGGETGSAGCGYSSWTDDSTDGSGESAVKPGVILSSGALGIPMEIFEPTPFRFDLHNPDPAACSDDEEGDEDDEMDDDSQDEADGNMHPRNSTSASNDTVKPSRKLRRLRSNPRDIASRNGHSAEETPSGPYKCHPATLSSRFRPLVQDGKVQFEVWVVAFLKIPSSASRDGGSEVIKQVLIDPQQHGTSTAPLEERPVLVNLPHTTPPVTAAESTTVITIINQPSERQRQISSWIEQVAQLLGTHVLGSFVRNEVAHSRVGIDFKKILQEKKVRPQRRTVN
ncbi:hypothetical protein EMPS_10749 [Entomortierella parvispora]|uniref:Uncharacterized protein n=1 Tax=Entomortierella parvispora TaxID=205924 RepID=A0A9P3HKG5_9FUNG|nr:hypothetical protein EMPS_10749 [Entomortierella parvispora]